MNDQLLIECKFAVSDAGEIEGKAWEFASADRIGDMIEPKAFENAPLPIPMLFGHDHNDPVGSWTEATIKEGGLHLKGKLLVDDLPRAREVRALVKSGAVRGLSVGFITRKAAPRKGGRTIHSLELLEASLVTIPMHPAARVTSAKSAIQALAIADAINRAAAHFKG
ncbi:HK97 family phage prohead protease [Pararhizobium mangrovi]|uniref:HK97 family phage prohead protease n=1 Tax=Pararhizobium mangrovi TaxID=2590452 RepID=A0A506TWD4_9HYPH|nr:HK97 family phage prohead protease [Pararhizobium mangrovi]TPW26383.1 HK97 family phage prohead protease [Pararhizobium mangrovi]